MSEAIKPRAFKTEWFAKAARKVEISDADSCKAIAQMRLGQCEVGTVSKATMRRFDESCLPVPEVLGPKQIKALRESYHVSQPVFASYLNISESTVEKWESGASRPNGAALKLLSIEKKTWA